MPAPFLMIDGYNLMHAAGLSRASYGPGDLAKLRHQLLVKLARRLRTDERKRCTVVFDAVDAPPNLPGRFKHEEMLVLFPKPGHEADELIESLIASHSAAKRLTVVSSDHRLQTAIRRRKGTAIDSDVFLKQLESPHRQIGSKPGSGTETSSPEKETSFWEQEFADLKPEEMKEQLNAESGETRSEWELQIERLQKQIADPDGLDDWLNEPPGRPRPRKPT